MQTGKTHIFPIVLIDEPGGNYWTRWQEFVKDDLLARGYISPDDLHLYKVTDSVDDAIAEVTQFYRVYHSMRYVRGELVLRLNSPLSAAKLESLQGQFADILVSGTFEQTGALPAEANEPALAGLPRLKFHFNKHDAGRLRLLINAINSAT